MFVSRTRSLGLQAHLRLKDDVIDQPRRADVGRGAQSSRIAQGIRGRLKRVCIDEPRDIAAGRLHPNAALRLQ